MDPQLRVMVLRRLLILLFLAGFFSPVSAQKIFQRKRPEIIPTNGKVRRGGFYVAPGFTYTLTRFKDTEEDLGAEPDTVYSAVYHPKGNIGLYLEAGYFHATRDPVILDLWDVGIAFKQFRGSEEFIGTFSYGDSIRSWEGNGSFNDRFITLHANANKFIQTSDHGFVQLTLGANADLSIGTTRGTSGLQIPDGQEFPKDLLGQVHLKVGYGFKLTDRMLVIPAIETPVFSISPSDDGRFGKLQWFSSEYRPLIFSVRFLFLRSPRGIDCPPPIKHNAFEKGRTKEYKPDNYHP